MSITRTVALWNGYSWAASASGVVTGSLHANRSHTYAAGSPSLSIAAPQQRHAIAAGILRIGRRDRDWTFGRYRAATTSPSKRLCPRSRASPDDRDLADRALEHVQHAPEVAERHRRLPRAVPARATIVPSFAPPRSRPP